ncbi:unnamed protein product [Angiostrongylus costaricensis]|uniref:Innexin n=1 Tax=Angiostrongylus costaricensis TaxID=334426 RepID=A0A0R3PLT7_ANGCS|nr:unnamed protein product [Angiostrongylus costaricensis]
MMTQPRYYNKPAADINWYKRFCRSVVETMLSNINNYIRQVKSTHDDDSIDRLNYVTTIYMLLGFALTLFAKNYVGEPMQCWVPNQWTAVWEVFSESYCFVENTYFVPMNDSNMPAVHTREGREMIYYQWVPFILSLMAFCFYIPRGVWKIFSPYSGSLSLFSMATTLRKVHTSKVVRYGSSLFNLYIVMKVAFCDLTVREMGNVNNWTVQCVLMVRGLLYYICRVKYVYTPWILCGTAFLVFAKEYVGTAIQCWVPRQWSVRLQKLQCSKFSNLFLTCALSYNNYKL